MNDETPGDTPHPAAEPVTVTPPRDCSPVVSTQTWQDVRIYTVGDDGRRGTAFPAMEAERPAVVSGAAGRQAGP